MKTKTRNTWLGMLFVAVLVATAMSMTVFGGEAEAVEYTSNMYATVWSLVPPLVAIILALITKEVYSSLFIGIVVGALFYANFDIKLAYLTIFTNADGGLLANLSSESNVGILIFLVILGIMVALMNKAGGSAAYGRWATKAIKSRRGALLSTFLLGVLVFVDDYFNCLTVGSVMRPVTDTHKVSRAKLAYIIDATAAPICIIAPISSWAAAVAGVVDGMNGLELFIKAIPYNFYALLSIVAMLALTITNTDFGPMLEHERNAQLNDDLYTTEARPYASAEAETQVVGNGKVIDLVLPVIVLIVACVIGMIYTGGFFEGESFVDAFANCNSSVGLMLGSAAALLITFVMYIPRKVLTFRQFMDCLPEGFKAMVPAIMILTFAWTLSGITGLLGADVFVAGILENSKGVLTLLIPVIVFCIAVFLAFATGTSWGTFGILLPIVVPIMPLGSEMLTITVAATLAGAVCGDHCSPISDTTIMASTGAQCDHINHVSTQLPYALVVAAVSAVNYVLAAVIQNWFINLPIAIISMIVVVLVIRKIYGSKELPVE